MLLGFAHSTPPLCPVQPLGGSPASSTVTRAGSTASSSFGVDAVAPHLHSAALPNGSQPDCCRHPSSAVFAPYLALIGPHSTRLVTPSSPIRPHPSPPRAPRPRVRVAAPPSRQLQLCRLPHLAREQPSSARLALSSHFIGSLARPTPSPLAPAYSTLSFIGSANAFAACASPFPHLFHFASSSSSLHLAHTPTVGLHLPSAFTITFISSLRPLLRTLGPTT